MRDFEDNFEKFLDEFPIGRLVKVAWVDSGIALFSNHGWESRDDMHGRVRGEVVAETAGYYLGRVEGNAILVAQSRDALNDDYLNAQAIWIPSIRGIFGLDLATV